MVTLIPSSSKWHLKTKIAFKDILPSWIPFLRTNETMTVVTEKKPLDVIFAIFDHVISSTLDQINIEIRSTFGNFKISIADDANAFVEINDKNNKENPIYRFLYDTNLTRIKRKMLQDFREPIVVENDNGSSVKIMTYNDALEQTGQCECVSLKVSVLDIIYPYERAVPEHVRRDFECIFAYDMQMDSVETIF